MTNSAVRWHISLPGERVGGLFLPIDDSHLVGIDDPAEVSEVVKLALAELDESTDRRGEHTWPDVRVETASGEHLVVRILYRNDD